MKPKLVVLVVVLLLVAMVPALVMAQSQAKPQQTGRVQIDIRQPIGPQLDAQLGRTPRAARVERAAPSFASRGSGIQPNAVYALLNEGFEGSLNAWYFAEMGGSSVGWDSTDYISKRGQRSLWSAGWGTDPYVYPYYEDDMYSWAVTEMDLQGARRIQVRFQFMNDSELGWDYFYWCGSYDGFWFDCYYHTGSTNDKWRLVELDSRNDPILASMLGSPFAYYGFLFESDPFCCVDRGAFVDAMRIRAWGPSPIN